MMGEKSHVLLVELLTRRIILETDAAAIAGRVSRPKADTTDIVINEQTLLNACESTLTPSILSPC